MHSIKLIALDLDGTLLHSDKTVSTANSNALRAVVDAGIHVILASGRMHSAILKYANLLGLPPDSFIISYNGGLVRSIAGGTLLKEPLDASSARYIVEFAKRLDLHLNYYLDDTLYVARETQYSKLYQERTGSVPHAVGDLVKFDGCRPTKLVVVDSKETVASLLPQMEDHFGSAITILKTDDEYLEFNAVGANKALALAAVSETLAITQEECVAMGDGYNDLSMLEWAGLGIAMANGRLELLSRISLHAPPADEDGVAVILRRLLAGTLTDSKSLIING